MSWGDVTSVTGGDRWLVIASRIATGLIAETAPARKGRCSRRAPSLPRGRLSPMLPMRRLWFSLPETGGPRDAPTNGSPAGTSARRRPGGKRMTRRTYRRG